MHVNKATSPQREFDQATLRRAFATHPSGVVAVGGLDGSAPVGLAASSFTSVSLSPAIVSISIAKSSTTWPTLRKSPRLGLSVLSAVQGEVCRALASKTASDRFRDVGWTVREGGAVLVEEALLWLECSIATEIDAGDHDMILLSVHEVTCLEPAEPLVFHGSRFRELVQR